MRDVDEDARFTGLFSGVAAGGAGDPPAVLEAGSPPAGLGAESSAFFIIFASFAIAAFSASAFTDSNVISFMSSFAAISLRLSLP